MDRRLRELSRALAHEQRCARCGRVYCELDNVGAWRCRVHPAHLAGAAPPHALGVANTYACCNRAPPAPGCVRCDHVRHDRMRELLTDAYDDDSDSDDPTAPAPWCASPLHEYAALPHHADDAPQQEPTLRMDATQAHALFGERACVTRPGFEWRADVDAYVVRRRAASPA